MVRGIAGTWNMRNTGRRDTSRTMQEPVYRRTTNMHIGTLKHWFFPTSRLFLGRFWAPRFPIPDHIFPRARTGLSYADRDVVGVAGNMTTELEMDHPSGSGDPSWSGDRKWYDSEIRHLMLHPSSRLHTQTTYKPPFNSYQQHFGLKELLHCKHV